MNILTFDIEEWYLAKKNGTVSIAKFKEYDRTLDFILRILNECDIQATFFCLGGMASEFPDVINKIERNGHEIGSHSYSHLWVNKMTPEEFDNDTRKSVESLENLIGKKIRSFRAPAFSIGEKSKWALEILNRYGIENDASIFPGERDFGGFPTFNEPSPCVIAHNDIKINEFPIPLFNIPLTGRSLAFSGGGYFRLLPLWFIKKRMKKQEYNMCYFHIEDLLTDKLPMMTRYDYETYFKENGSYKNRLLRYFKSNIGRDSSLSKLEQLIKSFNFVSIEQYLAKKEISTIHDI